MSAVPSARLGQLDALRGLAALSVVLFHYTTRYATLYPGAPQVGWALPLGHYGVNLFFIISGFVIFMTMARTVRPADFLVSRFSRLYPAYWVAVALTFALTHALSLPDKTVPWTTALANGLMFHGFFNVAHVDGVYWTLEVELTFYALILMLFASGQIKRIHALLLGLLALRLVYHGAALLLHVDLSWTLSRLLILPSIPWFALGICIYQWSLAGASQPPARISLATALAAVVSLALVDAPAIALMATGFTGIVYAAARARLRWLEAPPLVWLGAISYPLYLLHENIGWALMLRLTARGWSPGIALGATLLLVLLLSDALSRLVERPAMRFFRQQYRARAQAAPRLVGGK